MAKISIPKVTDSKWTLNDFNNDLNQAPNYTLDDFRDDPDQVAPVGNRVSNVNAAAYSAALNFDPSDIIDSYNRVVDEMSTKGVSATMTNIVSTAQNVNMDIYKNDIYHVLADPTLTDQEKDAAVRNTFNRKSDIYSPMNLLMTSALQAPVDGETKEEANQRLNSSLVTLKLAENKQAMQEIYNKAVNKNNPAWTGKVADFAAEFLLPAGDSIAASRIRADQDGSAAMAFIKTMFASGSSMETMRNRLINLPLDRQPAAAQALADIITEHSGATPFTQNNIAKLELLKSMIDPTGHTSFDVWKQNIGGIFDLAMSVPVVGGALKAAGKAVRGSLDAAEAVKAGSTLTRGGKDDLLNFERDFKANYESPKDRFKGTSNTQPFGPEVDVDSELFKRGLKEKLAEWRLSKPEPEGLEADIQGAIDSTKKKRRSSQEVDIDTAIKKWQREKPTADSLEEGIKAAITKQQKSSVKTKPTTLEEQLAEEIRASQASKASSDVSDFEKALSDDISKWSKAEVLESNGTRDAITNSVQPASVSQVLKEVNSDKAKAIHQAVVVDTSESVAEAAYGTSRAEAIAHDLLPQVGHVDGSVSTRVPNIDVVKAAEAQVPQKIKDLIDNDGKIQFSDLEKAGTRAWAEKNFREAFGALPRPEMTQVFPHMDFKTTDTGFRFRSVIGPNSSDPEHAMALARYAARNSGISDKDLTLLRKEGDSYVPTTLADEVNRPKVNALGTPANDYLVGVDHTYVMDAADVRRAGAYQPNDVRKNWLDGMRLYFGKGTEGTLNTAVIDPASMFSPVVTKSAFQGVDRESAFGKALLSMVKDFADEFNSLNKTRQRFVLNEIRDANLNRRDYNLTKLMADGASEAEINTLRNFKKFQDTVWWMDNKTLVNHLKDQGWFEFVDDITDTKELVRKVASSEINTATNIYDHSSNTIRKLTQEEIDKVVSSGGGFGKLRNPFIDENGAKAEHIVYADSPKGSYLRALSGDTQALRYLPGYYKISYDQPWFIVETLKDSRGKEVFSRAVATAKDMPSAKLVRDTKNRTAQDGYSYEFREAREEASLGREYDTDVLLQRGNYRRRGQLLEDIDSPVDNLDKSYIKSPIESMVDSVRRVSKNAAMEDVMAAHENRVVAEFGHLLPKENGRVIIPRDLGQIRRDPTKPFKYKELADAVSSVSYANALRFGYANSLDESYKAVWNGIANAFGSAGLGSIERASRAMESISPTNAAKGAVFTALLALNPVRQAFVQGSQVAMLSAVNPRWLGSVGPGQIMYLALRQAGITDRLTLKSVSKLTGLTEKEADQMWKEFDLTGIAAGIDRQNMAAGAVHDAAQRMVDRNMGGLVHKATMVPRNITSIARTLGFDAGEFISSAGSWAAFRDQALRAGRNLNSAAVRNDIAALSRNYTGSMNRAGNLPQNENSLAGIFQFTQNMHKMVLGATTNRINSPMVRGAMVADAALLYGLPAGVVFSPLLVSVPPEWKDRLYQGLQGWTLNKTIELAVGENPELDWSGMNPFNTYGEMELIHSLWTTPFGEIVSAAPATSMIFGNNPRLTNFLKSVAQYTNLTPDFLKPHEFVDVATDFCKIASGCSNAFKARFALETHKKISGGNNITDDHVSTFAAAAALAGIPTMDESLRIFVNTKNYKETQAFREDVEKQYKQMKQWYADPTRTESELEHFFNMKNQYYATYGTDRVAAEKIFNQLLKRDLKNGDASMFTNAMKHRYLYSDKEAEALLDATPFEKPEDRETIRSWFQVYDNLKHKDEKGK